MWAAKQATNVNSTWAIIQTDKWLETGRGSSIEDLIEGNSIAQINTTHRHGLEEKVKNRLSHGLQGKRQLALQTCLLEEGPCWQTSRRPTKLSKPGFENMKSMSRILLACWWVGNAWWWEKSFGPILLAKTLMLVDACYCFSIESWFGRLPMNGTAWGQAEASLE